MKQQNLHEELANKLRLYLMLRGIDELNRENVKRLSSQELQYIIESEKLLKYVTDSALKK